MTPQIHQRAYRMTAPANIPHWPRLMSVALAANYVGLSPTVLREIGPRPVKPEGKRRNLYDKRDLDRWADRLSGQPLDESQITAETNDVEKRLLERINGNG